MKRFVFKTLVQIGTLAIFLLLGTGTTLSLFVLDIMMKKRIESFVEAVKEVCGILLSN